MSSQFMSIPVVSQKTKITLSGGALACLGHRPKPNSMLHLMWNLPYSDHVCHRSSEAEQYNVHLPETKASNTARDVGCRLATLRLNQ